MIDHQWLVDNQHIVNEFSLLDAEYKTDLLNCVNWISNNMRPEDVFPDHVLEEWAAVGANTDWLEEIVRLRREIEALPIKDILYTITKRGDGPRSTVLEVVATPQKTCEEKLTLTTTVLGERRGRNSALVMEEK